MHQLSETGGTGVIRTEVGLVARVQTKVGLQVRCRREAFRTVGTRMRSFTWKEKPDVGLE